MIECLGEIRGFCFSDVPELWESHGGDAKIRKMPEMSSFVILRPVLIFGMLYSAKWLRNPVGAIPWGFFMPGIAASKKTPSSHMGEGAVYIER